MVQAIPYDIALKICYQIRQEHSRRWYSPVTWHCWLCTKLTHGDTPGLIETRENCTGCNNVTRQYLLHYTLPEIVD